MKLGIMQPYFFPYAQQFRHISQCDSWVIFDTPKFSRKSWVSRNRIINQDTEWSYISVPIVKNASKSSILSAKIANLLWREKFFRTLNIYKNKAPYYHEAIEIIKESINGKFETIADLNSNIIKTISLHLNIRTKIERLSETSINLPEAAPPDKWACIISKALGAQIYSNAPGGKHLFNIDDFNKQNIILEFYLPKSLEYKTPGFKFINDLSIVDSLMWMGISNIKAWCHNL